MELKTVNDFIAFSLSSRTIAFKAIYAEITGDIVAGLLLSQIVFWHLPSKSGYSKLRVEKNGKWWIAKKRTDWFEEVWISDRQYDRIIKILGAKTKYNKHGLGIVDVEIYKFAGIPQPHIALNYNVLFELLNKQMAKYAKQGSNTVYKKPKKKVIVDDEYTLVKEYLAKQSDEYRKEWGYFNEMRDTKLKKPMTTHAQKIMLFRLEELFPNNPAEHIRRFKQSTELNYAGVYWKKEIDTLKRGRIDEGY